MAECSDLTMVQPWRRSVASLLSLLYLGLIFLTPLAMVAHGSATLPFGLVEVLAAPLAYLGIAGLLSRLHAHRVVEGRMRVDTAIPAYFHRRLYGLCWTAVYYSGPLYFLVLAVPLLRRIVFRLFGYRGSLDFTLYPDSWIRDLPLLDLGKGCYISNKATLGTNMIFFRNGERVIEVGRIRIGERAMIGHLSALGPSVTVGEDAQVGVMVGIGRRAHIGARAVVGDRSVVDHGGIVEPCGILPTMAYLGMKQRVTTECELTPGMILNWAPKSRLVRLPDFQAQEK